MIEIDITLPLSYTDGDIRRAVLSALPTLREEELLSVRVHSLAVDTAQRPPIGYRARAVLCVSSEREAGLLKMKKRVRPYETPELCVPKVKRVPKHRPVVVGMGPAGIFCALVLAEAGLSPIVLERGRPVEERAREVDAFFSGGALNTESNIQFGEGGAGAFSDGKLKYGRMDGGTYKVLCEFVAAGAPADILTLRSPHIGTDRLPRVVRALREKILSLGGEIRFSNRMREVELDGGRVCSVLVDTPRGGGRLLLESLFLATGHSARDVFYMLEKKGVSMSARPFGMGVRIEHKRRDVDRMIYGEGAELDRLPAASYHLVTHLSSGRSVYSFCMCPGGSVVAATSCEGGIVTNGMSPYARDGENSNAALLVSLFPEDFPGDSPTRAISFQEQIERRAYELTGSYRAPVERLCDFMNGEEPTPVGHVQPTYPVGYTPISLDALLPPFITDALREAIRDFDAYRPGFFDPDAILTAPETRSTSPVRIERDPESLESISHGGLYPVGEGSGYGGGILSSAADGIRCALAYLKKLSI